MEKINHHMTLFSEKFTNYLMLIGEAILRYGDKLDKYEDVISSRRKYIIDVVLRMPLVFAIHQWYLLSAYSDFFIIDIVFFCARHFCALVLFGCWGMQTKNILLLYCLLLANFLIGWLTEACYWMFENEAYQTCRPNCWLCKEVTATYWWTLQFLTLSIQSIYIACLVKIFKIDREFGKSCLWLWLVLVPSVICMVGIWLWVLAPIYYWFSKALCAFYLIFPLLARIGTDQNLQKVDVNGRQMLPPLPGKWFVRDVYALFGFVYFLTIVLSYVILTKDIANLISYEYVFNILGTWCTSVTIIMAIASMMAVLSNTTVLLSRYFVSGQFNLIEIFDVNIGGRVQLGMTVFCFEASLLTVNEDKRIANMKSVMFLTMYIIVCQCWDLTEHYFLGILNGGETRKITSYIKIIVFSMILVLGPTCITYYASDFLGIKFWLLLNASGNFNLVVRAFLTLIEVCLVSVTWYVDNCLDKLEDAIYYTRVLKSLATLVCVILLSYYRLVAPFFNGSWVIRIPLIFCDAFIIGKMIVIKEWETYQKRRLSLGKLTSIPKASAYEIAAIDDVCPVCFASMTSAKKLPCDHVVHENCLRRWLQIRTTCPLCNKDLNLSP